MIARLRQYAAFYLFGIAMFALGGLVVASGMVGGTAAILGVCL